MALLSQLLTPKQLDTLDLKEIEIIKGEISKELNTGEEVRAILEAKVQETLRVLGKEC